MKKCHLWQFRSARLREGFDITAILIDSFCITALFDELFVVLAVTCYELEYIN